MRTIRERIRLRWLKFAYRNVTDEDIARYLAKKAKSDEGPAPEPQGIIF